MNQLDLKKDRIRTTTQEVKLMLDGLDRRKVNVSNWVLRKCSSQLAEKTCDMINTSLEQGKLPKDWKRPDIVPIYKNGNREDPLNYRPISLTSVIAKLCERVVKKKWMEHIEKNNILTERQFGFRGRSCSTNLISFYSRVIDIMDERDGWVDCIYLDLKKAFNKVPHKTLMWKLEHEGGIGGSVLKWMEDFLSNRGIRTVIRNIKSSWKGLTNYVRGICK